MSAARYTLLFLALTPAVRADDGVELFEKKIRPVLNEHCFACHSAQAKKLRGSLQLDSRAGMLQGGDSGPAIVVGQPGTSRLIRAVQYGDVELQMPPKGKLPAAAIADLTEWVRLGAPWPNESATKAAAATFDLAGRKSAHWAWQPIRAAPPPLANNASWSDSPIDRFILANCEREHLRLTAPAEPAALLRRVYFDITGLPPPAEVAQAFAANHSPAALAALVDRLLAAPQFGERWGRHWLDLVRYAESRGHEFDYHIANPWQYRDYVIRAFNADVPYDRFVMEHLAGDLLPGPRRNPALGFNESILATGFWFFGDQVHSPVDLRQDEADHLDNMIDVFSKTFLAMTVSCARCHDHKFDAISTRDYYALAGVLESSSYRQLRFETAEQERAVADKLRALESRHSAAVRAELAELLRKKTAQRTESLVVPLPAAQPPGARTIIDYASAPASDWRSDGAAFGAGPRRTGEILLGGDRPHVNVRPAAVCDPAWLTLKAVGQNDPGDLGKVMRAGRTIRSPEVTLTHGRLFYLVRGRGLAYAAVNAHQMMEGPLHRTLVKPIDGGGAWGWVEHDLKRYAGHRTHIEFTATSPDFAVAAVIESAEPPAAQPPLRFALADCLTAIDRFAKNQLDEKSAAVVEALLTQAQFQPGPAWTQFGNARRTILNELPVTSHLTPAMLDGNGVDEHVFIRGNPNNLGDVVPRRFLEALIGDRRLPGPGSGRLELAREVTDPTINPLVARVIVNRVWHHLFGRGIVASVDNFGVLGDRPTHPELLDWLADDFVKNGWSIKKLIRTIVLTRTYQMSSSGDSAADRADPQNKLLHRANVRRLEGEAIRDAMLAVAGTLKPTMFGPPAPVHLTPFMDGRGRPSKSGPLDGAGRRSIYLEIRRNFPDPFLVAFDQPAPASTMGRRNVSNVPAQALVMLNDPLVHQQSAAWSERICEEYSAPAERVEQMYWQAFARPPTETEKTACLEFVAKNSWPDLAHALWNLKEFIYLH